MDSRTTHWLTEALAGGRATLVPLPLDNAEVIRLDGVHAPDGYCITAVDLVRPLSVNPDGTCATIDIHAARAAALACPPPERP